MKVIQNKQVYWEFIRQLRNDQRVKGGFVQQKHITRQEHESFMQKRGDNFYICLLSEQPAGYVGIIDRDIRVATHPDFQNKGIGKFMINSLMELHPDAFAKVKIENEASLKLFESCDFKKKYYILER